VICFKPTAFDDLVKQGKPGVNIEPKSWHQKWWVDSQKVLRIADPQTAEGMSSSTNIFVTEIARALVDHIELIYRKPFARVLTRWLWTKAPIYQFRREWTEYKLYWLFVEHLGRTRDYDPDNPLWGKSIWGKTETVDEELFRTIFDLRNEGYFTICQSTRLPVEVVREQINKYL
jgi:hypothetical protein